MGTVSSIDDGNLEMAGDEIGGAGGGVAHDQAIGLHGVERVHGVEKGFAFFYAGGFRLEIHGVGTEPRGGGAEADARAGGIFEKSESDGFATKSSEFLERMALDFLERFALVEEKSQFIRGERFESEKVAEAVCHTVTR